MSYAMAIDKAWHGLANLNIPKDLSVKFLADEYTFDSETRQVFSLSCNVPAKEYAAIILLHYLSRKLEGLPALSGEWLTFRELAGIEGYQSAFGKRVIEPIARKYGHNPEGLVEAAKRFNGKRQPGSDAGVVLEVLEGVPLLIELWKADEEFGASVNILFDRSIKDIFCTEDVIVLAEIVARSL